MVLNTTPFEGLFKTHRVKAKTITQEVGVLSHRLEGGGRHTHLSLATQNGTLKSLPLDQAEFEVHQTIVDKAQLPL
jgi:hypothetical protein